MRFPRPDNISSSVEKRTNLIPPVRFHLHAQQQVNIKVQLSVRSVNTTPLRCIRVVEVDAHLTSTMRKMAVRGQLDGPAN